MRLKDVEMILADSIVLDVAAFFSPHSHLTSNREALNLGLGHIITQHLADLS